MSNEPSPLSYYLENVRYFCDPASMSDLKDTLKAIYEAVCSEPESVNLALIEAFDLNIRQLLKNVLTQRSKLFELPDLQRIITISGSIIQLARDQKNIQEHMVRWQFANQVVQDRKHELSVDSDRIVSRPQVKILLELLAKHKTTRRGEIESSLAISKQRATNLLRDLKAFSFIEEHVSDEDKRSREYSLTELGEKKCIELGYTLVYHHTDTGYENSNLHKTIIRRHLKFAQPKRAILSLGANVNKQIGKVG